MAMASTKFHYSMAELECQECFYVVLAIPRSTKSSVSSNPSTPLVGIRIDPALQIVSRSSPLLLLAITRFSLSGAV